jgi:hypothetical protein
LGNARATDHEGNAGRRLVGSDLLLEAMLSQVDAVTDLSTDI